MNKINKPVLFFVLGIIGCALGVVLIYYGGIEESISIRFALLGAVLSIPSGLATIIFGIWIYLGLDEKKTIPVNQVSGKIKNEKIKGFSPTQKKASTSPSEKTILSEKKGPVAVKKSPEKEDFVISGTNYSALSKKDNEESKKGKGKNGNFFIRPAKH